MTRSQEKLVSRLCKTLFFCDSESGGPPVQSQSTFQHSMANDTKRSKSFGSGGKKRPAAKQAAKSSRRAGQNSRMLKLEQL